MANFDDLIDSYNEQYDSDKRLIIFSNILTTNITKLSKYGVKSYEKMIKYAGASSYDGLRLTLKLKTCNTDLYNKLIDIIINKANLALLLVNSYISNPQVKDLALDPVLAFDAIFDRAWT